MSDQPTVSGAMDSMPGWLKALMLVGNTLGIPVLILGFYLLQDAGMVGNPVAKELQELKGLAVQHDATMRELSRHVEEQGRQMEDEAKGRQMRCVMRAQTEAEKKACFPIADRER